MVLEKSRASPLEGWNTSVSAGEKEHSVECLQVSEMLEEPQSVSPNTGQQKAESFGHRAVAAGSAWEPPQLPTRQWAESAPLLRDPSRP